MLKLVNDQQKNACAQHIIKHKSECAYFLQDTPRDHNINSIQKTGQQRQQDALVEFKAKNILIADKDHHPQN